MLARVESAHFWLEVGADWCCLDNGWRNQSSGCELIAAVSTILLAAPFVFKCDRIERRSFQVDVSGNFRVERPKIARSWRSDCTKLAARQHLSSHKTSVVRSIKSVASRRSGAGAASERMTDDSPPPPPLLAQIGLSFITRGRANSTLRVSRRRRSLNLFVEQSEADLV